MPAGPAGQASRRSLPTLRRWAPLLVVLFSLVYLQVGLTRWLNHFDEGLVCVGAERVLRGELPYRDFWSFYAPGQFYLVAGVFRLLGVTVLAERLLGIAELAALLLLLFLLCRRVAGEAFAWSGWLLALTWKLGPPLALGVTTALLLGMASLLCLLLFLERRGRWLIPAGLLTGLALLFRQDFGLYFLFAEALTLLLYLPRERLTWRPLGAYLLSLLAMVVPVAGYFLWQVPLSTLVEDLLVYPLTVYPHIWPVPFPTLHNAPLPLPNWAALLDWGYLVPKLRQIWPFYFPLLVYLGGLISVIRFWRRPERIWSALPLVLLGAVLFYNLRFRADAWHLWPWGLPAAVLLALLADCLWRQRESHRFRGWAALALIALPVLTIVLPQLLLWSHWYREAPPAEAEFLLPRARGLMREPADYAYQAAVGWVLTHVPENETLYVGPCRHDCLDLTDVMFYFLAQRRPATRWHEMEPGVITTAAVQRQVIADLEVSRPPCVVLDQRRLPPGGDMAGQVATLLDDYLREHYAPVQTFPLPPDSLFKGYVVHMWRVP